MRLFLSLGHVEVLEQKNSMYAESIANSKKLLADDEEMMTQEKSLLTAYEGILQSLQGIKDRIEKVIMRVKEAYTELYTGLKEKWPSVVKRITTCIRMAQFAKVYKKHELEKRCQQAAQSATDMLLKLVQFQRARSELEKTLESLRR